MGGTVYELWETAAGNIVGRFATDADALAVVRESVAAYGVDYAATWALLREDDDEAIEAIASGDALVKLASQPVTT